LIDYILSGALLRHWVRAVSIIVVVLVASSIFYNQIHGSSLGSFVEEQLDKIRDVSSNAGNMPPGIFLAIILNNLQVLAVMVILSPTLVLPLLIASFQGVVVGYMVSQIIEGGGVSVAGVDFKFDPVTIYYALSVHGVVEVPAIALILSPLIAVREYGFVRSLKNMIRLIPIAALLLVIAAVIESTVTLIALIIIIAVKILIGGWG